MSGTRVLLAAVLVLSATAGCSGSDAAEAGPLAAPASAPAGSGTASQSPGPAATADVATRQITVTIAKGRITPPPKDISVKKGERVSLTVTSDREDEVHVHGIDKEIELTPNVPGTLSFVATPTGSFEVETHETELLLFHLDVTN